MTSEEEFAVHKSNIDTQNLWRTKPIPFRNAVCTNPKSLKNDRTEKVRRGTQMPGWWAGLLRAIRLPSFFLGGSTVAIMLVLARYARLAALLAAVLPIGAGLIQSRLALARGRRKAPRDVRRKTHTERGVGRLCVVFGIAFVALAAILPVAIVVASGFALSSIVALRSLAVVGDNAILEGKCKTGSTSPAKECTHIERWVERVSTMPSGLAKRLAKIATTASPAGEVTKLRALPVALVAMSVAVFGATGGSLAAVELAGDGGNSHLHPAIESSPLLGIPPVATNPPPSEAPTRVTYQQACPQLPDPLAIGHGLGALFRYDGAFKAGCGTEPEQVIDTGAWISRGICAGQLRSLAVTDTGRDGVLLYGAAARFALRVARQGKLVSAEAAHPADGDVYVVKTLSGSFGFARQAPTSGSEGGEVRDCTDVTGTDRPMARLNPPMLLHWRDLLRQRGSWSWPASEAAPGERLAFLSYPNGEIIARGVCSAEFACYLEVSREIWPGDETSWVSLSELEPFMPS